MADVSDRLRVARERAGLSLEQISAITKIKVALLSALERGDFGQLPGTFFTRAFLRSYAREVGLPPDEIVQEFDDEMSAMEPEPEFEPRIERPAFPLSGFHLPRGLVSAAAVLVLAAAVAASRHRPAPGAAESGAVGTGGVAAAGMVPASQSGTVREPETLLLDIRPSDAVWVAATADGQRILYRALLAGEETKLEARDEIALRIGNAAAFSYTINGVPGRVLGGPSEVAEVRITRANYRTFAR